MVDCTRVPTGSFVALVGTVQQLTADEKRFALPAGTAEVVETRAAGRREWRASSVAADSRRLDAACLYA